MRSSIWYADGSIVLQAGQMQFCVHAGVLSQHSVVFREMLAIPQDGLSIDKVDGHPLVHVSDTTEEITYLLQALYDPSRIKTTQLTSQTARMLCALLRLSSKYMIAHIRAVATYPFIVAFSSDLSTSVAMASTGSWTIREWHFEVANTCHQCELLSPLPSLFYRFSQTLDGVGIFRSVLTDGLKEVLFSALPKIERSVKYFLHATFCMHEPPSSCPTPKNCRTSAVAMWETAVLRDSLGTGAFLEPLSFVCKPSIGRFPLCDACATKVNTSAQRARSIVWSRLPVQFDLGHIWDDLLLKEKRYQADLSAKEDIEPQLEA